MALPIVAGVMTVAGWFMKGGAIGSLLAHFGIKLTTKTAMAGVQIALMVLHFAARIAFLLAVLHFSFMTLNFLIYFFDALPTLLSSDTFLQIGYQLMQSIGLVQALKDAFAIFDVLFVSLLSAWALRFAWQTAEITSNEYFKLAMIVLA